MARYGNLLKFWLMLFALSSCTLFSGTSLALKAMDEDALSQSSPSLIEDETEKPYDESRLPEPQPISAPQKLAERKRLSFDRIDLSSEILPETGFSTSVCFTCHESGDIHAHEKTRHQWQALIEEKGHGIFATIVWSCPEEKDQVMRYLLEKAKDSRQQTEGIGFWQ